jgi:hypothetical protein
MDPGWDPTAFFTDPDESPLIVLDGPNELLANAAWCLGNIRHDQDGLAEEAEEMLNRAEQIATEAFQDLLDRGLELAGEHAKKEGK